MAIYLWSYKSWVCIVLYFVFQTDWLVAYCCRSVSVCLFVYLQPVILPSNVLSVWGTIFIFHMQNPLVKHIQMTSVLTSYGSRWPHMGHGVGLNLKLMIAVMLLLNNFPSAKCGNHSNYFTYRITIFLHRSTEMFLWLSKNQKKSTLYKFSSKSNRT